MLKIIYGKLEDDNLIYDPNTYFDFNYEDEWITDSLSVQMIKDIENADVVGPNLIQNPILGPVSPKSLSGGVKTLILVNNDNSSRIFNVSACGDNCAKWLLEIGKHKDVVVNLRHLMYFGLDGFEFEILNNHTIVHNEVEFLNAVTEYSHKKVITYE